MGYFSQLAITLEARVARRREPKAEPRDRLVERIADLTDRLEDFKRPVNGQLGAFGTVSDRTLKNSIIRYVLPEDLLSYDEVLSARMLTEDDLWELDHKDLLSVTFLMPGQMFLASVMERCGSIQ